MRIDARLAASRVMRDRRGLALSVVTLALGVGAVLTCFAVVRTVLFSPWPWSHADRVVRVWDSATESLTGQRSLAVPDFVRLQRSGTSARAWAAYTSRKTVLGDPVTDAQAPEIRVASTTASLFSLLGVVPVVGRPLVAQDELAAADRPVVVSERVVAREGVAGTLGREITIGGEKHVIVGIMPAAFWFPDEDTNYWTPLPRVLLSETSPAATGAIALLPPNNSVRRFCDEATALLVSFSGDRIGAIGLKDDILAASQSPLWVMQLAALLVALLAFMNVRWLLEARGQRQRSAFAVMRTLGATPGRIFFGWMCEAGLIGALAVPLVLFSTWTLIRVMVAVDTGALPLLRSTRLDLSSAAVGAVCAVALTLLAGLPLGMRLLKDRAIVAELGPSHARRAMMPYGRMVLQTSLAFALSGFAVEIGLHFATLLRSNVGLGNTDFLVTRLTIRTGEPANVRVARLANVVRGLEARGISAALANAVPLDQVELQTTAWAGDERCQVAVRVVTPPYFQICGLPAWEGRVFSNADAGRGTLVVNEALAQRLLGGGSPLGRAIRLGTMQATVLGVVPSVGHSNLHQSPEPVAYVMLGDAVRLGGLLEGWATEKAFVLADLRDRNMVAVSEQIRRSARRECPDAQLGTAWRFGDRVWLASGPAPLLALGFGVLAAVALVLLAAGVYGSVSHGLALRARSIAIRMAVGATPLRILAESAAPAVAVYSLAGLLGTATVVAGQRAVSGLILLPAAARPPALGIVLALAAAALAVNIAAACWVPINRARRIDVVSTLRAE